MKGYKLLLLLMLTTFISSLFFAKNEEKDPKTITKEKKESSSIRVKEDQAVGKDELTKVMGISPVVLGLSTRVLEKELTKLDSRFSGFNGKLKDHYFQKIPILKGRKITADQLMKLAVVIDDKVFYNNAIEYLLISFSTKHQKNKSLIYHPIEIVFPNQKIHEKLKVVHLKFYENQLYESLFIIEANINEMNELVELYHQKLGEKSDYNKVTETYFWKEKEYQISLNVRGNGFPRQIKLQFIQLSKLELFWSDLGKVQKKLDELLEKNKIK